MKTYSEGDHICYSCVGEPFLQQEIQSLGVQKKCAFCRKVRRSYKLIQLADRIEAVFLDLYERTPDQPDDWEYMRIHDKESTFQWYREGQTVLSILVDEYRITKEAAAEVAAILEMRHSSPSAEEIGEETEFDSDVQYELKGFTDERWLKAWNRLAQILKYESRFFNKEAADILASIFDGLEDLRTRWKKPVFAKVGPSEKIKSLYRARVFQSREKLLEALCKPDILLGSPGSATTMNGRMNARGISVFYGATEESVALAEGRPPVGSKVATACFEIIKPLRLLDLRELENIHEAPSVFNPRYTEIMEKVIFLRRLKEVMTAPVLPDDELFQYLPTQAVADYLASRIDIKCDGIIYPSVQVTDNKINIVLFNKSSRVDSIVLAAGTRIQATDEEYSEEGAYTFYKVIEIPPPATTAAFNEDDFGGISTADTRDPVLRINLASIRIHEIRSVTYTFTSHDVYRNKLIEDDGEAAKFDTIFGEQ